MRRRLLCGIFAVLLNSGGLIAATKDGGVMSNIATPPPGKIQFEQTKRSFGVVPRGAILKQEFKFTNTGPGLVAIQGFYASCGCLVADIKKGHVYQPGEQGIFTVSLDTSHYKGKIEKSITLYTDERKGGKARTLTLKANVDEEITAEPPVVDFGEVAAGEAEEQVVTIKGLKLPAGLEIENLKYNDKLLEVTQEQKGQTATLHINLKDGAPAGFISDTIIVENNSEHLPKLPVLVRGFVNGNIALKPDYLEFGAIDRSKKKTQVISLNAPQPFQIVDSKIELNINGKDVPEVEKYFEIEKLADKPLLNRNLKVKLKNAGTGGSVHGKLILETSDPAQKELVVEFYAFFKG